MPRSQHKLLALAIHLSASAHVNQLDRGGKAYILHPMRIMMRLRTDDAEIMQMAALHDTVEDTTITIKQLIALGFSTRVTDALTLLTHDPKDSYEAYITDISTNRDATLIKLEDLRDNSDITRLKGVSEKDLARMEKYHKAYTFLKAALHGG